VRLAVDHRAFARFDPAVPGWTSEAGEHQLLVGTSGADIAATAPVHLPARTTIPL
jgi:hypothetical protein